MWIIRGIRDIVLAMIATWREFWRVRRYREIIQDIALAYQRAPDPYYIAKKNRERFPNNTTYGAIEIPSLLDLISDCDLSKGVFYDLGSGDGKTLLAVKLAYPQLEVRGIEMIPDLVEVSRAQYRRYLELHQLSVADFKIEHIEGDFLTIDCADAAIIFINATGFETCFWEAVEAKLRQIKPLTKVIVTSKTLPCPPFRLMARHMEKMSWGFVATAIYEKRG